MTDLDKFTDRDLLVRITMKVEDIEPRLKQVEDDVLTLKLASAKQSGMFAGAGKLWALLTSLPVGVAAFLFGQHR